MNIREEKERDAEKKKIEAKMLYLKYQNMGCDLMNFENYFAAIKRVFFLL